MSHDAIVTLLVTGAILFALVRNAVPPDLLFLGATALLAALGIITAEEAFAGFSNHGMLTVGFLFVLAAALRETGALDWVGHRLLGSARSNEAAFLRLAVVVIPLSAFLNNTPIVAMLLPVVVDWSRRNSRSPSKLLLPLSYLAILGGTCTMIGTSTNLVVAGLATEAGLPEIGLFELGWVGLPYAVVGVAYLALVGQRLLPERTELLERLEETRREYIVEMLVQPGCRLIGQSVEAAGLRHLPALFLVEIDRNGDTIGPVPPDTKLHAGDRLVFTGVVSSIVDLERIPGLVPAADDLYEVSERNVRGRRLSEAVISDSSPLVGVTIREAEFRARYGAAVVAVHRNGERLRTKLGDVVLRPGDTLLLQTTANFARAHRNDPAFYLVGDVADYRPVRRDKAWIAIALFVAMVVAMTTEVVPTVVAAGLTVFLALATGCLSAGAARTATDWPVLVTIAASFGVGAALEKSGAAGFVAGGLVRLVADHGEVAALAALYLVVSLVTEVVTNNAAAVLFFPICLETAARLDADPQPFLVALMLAASASFMTPIGYQTNMMVYGPGGYRFSDFVRVGLPLNLVLWVVATLLIPWIWPF